MEFPEKRINEYASLFTSAEPEVLAELNRETWANVLMPRMLSGHIQGRILSMFSQMIRPECILEIGTYTGYSALCLAEGLRPDGVLHTIDINEELESMIRRYFDQSPYSSNIHLHIGDARSVIPRLEGIFDLVFIDADKENYANYFDMVIERVRPGGFIIADNVLWSGKVLDPEQDPETLALHRFNEKIKADSRVSHVLLPVRDGLMIARKND